MGGLGITELVVVLFMGIIYAIPIAAAVWIIKALRRNRADNEVIKSKLEAIEQQLQRTVKTEQRAYE